MPLLAVKRTVHDVARVRQSGRELPVQIRIVFDYKKPQAKPPCPAFAHFT
jgi:hypothetical protein